nr:MAG TPA: hypothetical protein [Caudoviricetes sp.]
MSESLGPALTATRVPGSEDNVVRLGRLDSTIADQDRQMVVATRPLTRLSTVRDLEADQIRCGECGSELVVDGGRTEDRDSNGAVLEFLDLIHDCHLMNLLQLDQLGCGATPDANNAIVGRLRLTSGIQLLEIILDKLEGFIARVKCDRAFSIPVFVIAMTDLGIPSDIIHGYSCGEIVIEMVRPSRNARLARRATCCWASFAVSKVVQTVGREGRLVSFSSPFSQTSYQTTYFIGSPCQRNEMRTRQLRW